jgi:hypothetical protein
MGIVVDFHQMIQVDVSVALGRRKARVSEHLLDRAEVRALLEKMRREAVAERVWMDAPRGAGAEWESLWASLTFDAPRAEGRP